MDKAFLLELGVGEDVVEQVLEAYEVSLACEAEKLAETPAVADRRRPALVIPPCGAVSGGAGKSVPSVL